LAGVAENGYLQADMCNFGDQACRYSQLVNGYFIIG